ncbi:MAG: lysine--tRNA ligase, partial [Gammaproteobacteria bacterium]|nr:lysine--tRNA ligase [Gammaproteobacteria bacterium]
MQSKDDNDIISQRRARLDELRATGNAYPNDFRRDTLAADLHERFGGLDREQLEAETATFKLAGRMMSRRVMGKVAFVHLRDMSGQIQLFLQRSALSAETYTAFKQWDIGDIIAVTGRVFRTKTGELSIHADSLRLLVKSLRPLPEKFHGLADQETRYRRRYLDLITNAATRRTFLARSRIIDRMRAYLGEQGFLEVETPMMQPIPGGAAARPFSTHHNTLDMELFLRIAPELYLKRLVVGGFEKVFEINRNFRNEGLSPQHNPEFTMLEFYWAYAGYEDLMTLTEDLLRTLATAVHGDTALEYQGETCDFTRPFQRMTLAEANLAHNPSLTPDDLDDPERLRAILTELGVELKPDYGLGKLQLELFEKTAEAQLRQPTFITAYPVEVSPLSRRSDSQPEFTERFELFICGREIANGFSELNDPEDQARRFRQQAEEGASGDVEAMRYDADYITALEYGLPPTAGEGIGIDRLAMLLTDS